MQFCCVRCRPHCNSINCLIVLFTATLLLIQVYALQLLVVSSLEQLFLVILTLLVMSIWLHLFALDFIQFLLFDRTVIVNDVVFSVF
jgi:hypothetical protein